MTELFPSLHPDCGMSSPPTYNWPPSVLLGWQPSCCSSYIPRRTSRKDEEFGPLHLFRTLFPMPVKNSQNWEIFVDFQNFNFLDKIENHLSDRSKVCVTKVWKWKIWDDQILRLSETFVVVYKKKICSLCQRVVNWPTKRRIFSFHLFSKIYQNVL